MPWPVWALGDRGLDRQHAAVRGAERGDRARQEIAVLAIDRGDQRAAAARGEREGVGLVLVGDDGGGRAEHFGVVHRLARAALGLEQGRRDESGLAAVDAVELGRVGAAGDDLGFARQRDRCPRARPSAARASTSGPMRVASWRGSPTVVLASRADSASATAPARSAGTKTRRMAVHFCPAFCVISRATSLMKASKAGVAGRRARRQQRGVDAVGLDVHARAAREHVAVAGDALRGIGRAGEGDHVVAPSRDRAGRRCRRTAG